MVCSWNWQRRCLFGLRFLRPPARDIWCLEIRWSARARGSFAREGERPSVCSNPVRSGGIKSARGTRTSGGTQYETTSFGLAVRVDRRGRAQEALVTYRALSPEIALELARKALPGERVPSRGRGGGSLRAAAGDAERPIRWPTHAADCDRQGLDRGDVSNEHHGSRCCNSTRSTASRGQKSSERCRAGRRFGARGSGLNCWSGWSFRCSGWRRGRRLCTRRH